MRERDWQAIDRHTSKIARADHSSFLLAARVGEEGEISAAPVADKPEIALRSINMILFSGHSPGEGNKCSILLAAFSIPAHFGWPTNLCNVLLRWKRRWTTRIASICIKNLATGNEMSDQNQLPPDADTRCWWPDRHRTTTFNACLVLDELIGRVARFVVRISTSRPLLRVEFLYS